MLLLGEVGRIVGMGKMRWMFVCVYMEGVVCMYIQYMYLEIQGGGKKVDLNIIQVGLLSEKKKREIRYSALKTHFVSDLK